MRSGFGQGLFPPFLSSTSSPAFGTLAAGGASAGTTMLGRGAEAGGGPRLEVSKALCFSKSSSCANSLSSMASSKDSSSSSNAWYSNSWARSLSTRSSWRISSRTLVAAPSKAAFSPTTAALAPSALGWRALVEVGAGEVGAVEVGDGEGPLGLGILQSLSRRSLMSRPTSEHFKHLNPWARSFTK